MLKKLKNNSICKISYKPTFLGQLGYDFNVNQLLILDFGLPII